MVVILFGSLTVSAQDSKPDECAEYAQAKEKEAVHRMISQHMWISWDEKALGRSCDALAIAIVKTIPESEITYPYTLKEVLQILHRAFYCPRCISSPANRKPNVTMLFLEHLHNVTSGPSQAEVDETREFIVKQVLSPE
jgi:hypothetical protein